MIALYPQSQYPKHMKSCCKVSGLACKEFGRHHSILIRRKKLQASTDKLNVILRSLREVRTSYRPPELENRWETQRTTTYWS